MNSKLFKLVETTHDEIASDPKQPFVVVWNLRADGYIVSPQHKIIMPDWVRHIQEGSAAIHNTDNLIRQHNHNNQPPTIGEQLSKQWVGSV